MKFLDLFLIFGRVFLMKTAMLDTKGIKEQILFAKTKKEIDSLIDKGYRFEYASNATKTAWKNARNKRLTDLNILDVEEKEKEKEEKVFSKKRSATASSIKSRNKKSI